MPFGYAVHWGARVTRDIWLGGNKSNGASRRQPTPSWCGGRELEILPDYVSGVWPAAYLQRLPESGHHRHEALEALQEVLDLVDWAKADADQMVEVELAAISR